MTFKSHRRKIDSIDSAIVALLGDRLSIVREMAEIKASKGIPIVDRDRENVVLKRIVRGRDAHLDEVATEVFREIIQQSRRVQLSVVDRLSRDLRLRRRARVAIAGTKGSYSEEAAVMLMGSDAKFVECGSFEEVFAALEAGDADSAVVPVRNKIIGEISVVKSLLESSRLHVMDGLRLTVRHVLAGTHDSRLEDLVGIRTHMEVVKQCGFFAKLNPEIQWLTDLDTGKSIAKVMKDRDPNIAAICSGRAARMLGAKILARDVTDDAKNWTNFSLIGFREINEE